VSDSLDPVPVNTTYNYEIEVTNFGPEMATDVTLTNILPGSLSIVSSFTDQGTCTETGGTVDCNIGSIAVDATVIVTIFVTAPGTSQTVSNTVTIAAISAELRNNQQHGYRIDQYWRQYRTALLYFF
jgi:uncharacterized repeat protein (TIGR01451 family)